MMMLLSFEVIPRNQSRQLDDIAVPVLILPQEKVLMNYSVFSPLR